MTAFVSFIRKRGVATTIAGLLAVASILLGVSNRWDDPRITFSLYAFGFICIACAVVCWTFIPPDDSAGAIKVKNSPGAVIERNTSTQDDAGIEIENSPGAKVVQNITDEASETSDTENGIDGQSDGP